MPSIPHVHRHFKKADPAIAALLRRLKPDALENSPTASQHFERLARSIIYQQLAGKAAATIHGRFVALFGRKKVTPKNLLAIPEKKLRAAGLSGAKARYVRDLAQKVIAREVRLNDLYALSDEEVIAELTKVKGIGRWTAEMFLIFTLGREDVFSHGDLGLRNGFILTYGKAKARSQRSIERTSQRWAPYRSYAALALWHAVDGGK